MPEFVGPQTTKRLFLFFLVFCLPAPTPPTITVEFKCFFYPVSILLEPENNARSWVNVKAAVKKIIAWEIYRQYCLSRERMPPRGVPAWVFTKSSTEL